MAGIKDDLSSKKNNYSCLTCVTGLWLWQIQPPGAFSLFFFEERLKNPAYTVFCTSSDNLPHDHHLINQATAGEAG
jgi:hypothetical protein